MVLVGKALANASQKVMLGYVRAKARAKSLTKKFLVGGGGLVVCLIIVSAPGPGLIQNFSSLGYFKHLKSFWWVGWWSV